MTGQAPVGPRRVVRKKRRPSPAAPPPAPADPTHSSRGAAGIVRAVFPPLLVGVAGAVLGGLEGYSLFRSADTSLAVLTGLLLLTLLGPVVLGSVAALVSAPRARFVGLIAGLGGIVAGGLVLAWLSVLGAPDAPRGGLGASLVALIIGFCIGYGLGASAVTSLWRSD